MKRLNWQIFLALPALLLTAAPALAFQLDPISREFAPAGMDATRSYTVINDGPDRIAVEITMLGRQVDMDGKETNPSAADEFLVYPSQLVLEPAEKQVVRVTWVGDPAPDHELAYRIIAEQLPIKNLSPAPIDPTARRGALTVLMTYRGTAYIRPEGVAPDVTLEAVAPRLDKGTPPTLEVVLSNHGTARAVLRTFTITVRPTGKGGAVELRSDQVPELANLVILAGAKRRLRIPWPAGLPEGPVSATLQWSPR